MFDYTPTVYLPKPGSKEIYQRLLTQVDNLGIPVIRSESEFEKSLKENHVILDAIFGESESEDLWTFSDSYDFGRSLIEIP